jgi:hypothetical protein
MEKLVNGFIMGRASKFDSGSEGYEHVVLLVYGMSGEEVGPWNCHNHLQQKFDTQMTFVNRPIKYPEPLYVHSSRSKAPVLATNRPIALKQDPVRFMYVMGLPDSSQLACFNYLDEMMAAVEDAKSRGAIHQCLRIILNLDS